jgi:GNAT superfamily N-acetyltransferase
VEVGFVRPGEESVRSETGKQIVWPTATRGGLVDLCAPHKRMHEGYAAVENQIAAQTGLPQEEPESLSAHHGTCSECARNTLPGPLNEKLKGELPTGYHRKLDQSDRRPRRPYEPGKTRTKPLEPLRQSENAAQGASVADDLGRWDHRQRSWDADRPQIEQSKDHGWFTLHAEPAGDDGDRQIHAVTENGRYIGENYFGQHPSRPGHLEGAPEVHPDYRRRGVASAMYDYASELGGAPLAPSDRHTDAAEAFWRSREGTLRTADLGDATDWDAHYDELPDTVHRGYAMKIPGGLYDLIHDHSADTGAVAKELITRTGKRATGSHWSVRPETAKGFALDSGRAGSSDLPLVLHAHKPSREDIETRPHMLKRMQVFDFGGGAHDEREVPLRKGRAVLVSGISWHPHEEHPAADEQGWIHHDFSEPMIHKATAEELKPLPDKLYHVTTARDAVLGGGLKSRQELGQQYGHGLGGGRDDTISLTSYKPTAEHLLHSLHEYHDVLNGKLKLADLKEKARTGVGAEAPYDYMLKDHPDEDLAAADKGRAIEHRMHDRSEVGEDWKPLDEGMHGTGPKGDYHLHMAWDRPMDRDELLHRRSDVYKKFAWGRQAEGGHLDPLFIGNDARSFADKDPGQFALLHVRPRPGAHGIQMNDRSEGTDAGEWRAMSGNDVNVVHHEAHEDIPHRMAAKYPIKYTRMTQNGYEDAEDEIEGPLYHGSRSKRLKPGDEITIGRRTNPWGDSGNKSDKVHFTVHHDTARDYADQAGGHVYEVEPTGPFAHDYSSGDFKSYHPLRVLRVANDPIAKDIEREGARTAAKVWWHGTPSGDMRGGAYGLHIGSREAARQALTARIGHPAEGEWDGTRKYGETLLAGKRTLHERGIYPTGYSVDAPGEDHYPTGKATYGSQEPIPPHSKPDIFPVRITGEMSNTEQNPHPDFKANGYMKAQLKRGTARRGYYYTNEGEDEGSVSAVVPGPEHVERVPRHEASRKTAMTPERRAEIERIRQERKNRPRRPAGQPRADAFSHLFTPIPEHELEEQRQARLPKPEPINDKTYSIGDVSKHYEWEGFDPYEIEHLVKSPEHAQFTHEDVPVHSLRHITEHGDLVKPPSYRDIADQGDDEQKRLKELERGHDDGAHIPPIVVVRDGEHHIIADGSHRAAIAAERGHTHIPAFVTSRTIMPKTGRMAEGGPDPFERTAAMHNPHAKAGQADDEWYHGSPHDFDSFADTGSGNDDEDHVNHWNVLLGNHFTATHNVAHDFSQGLHHTTDENGNDDDEPIGHVIHAKLHLKNPRVYKSEHDMDQEVHEHEVAHGNLLDDHLPARPHENASDEDWEEYEDQAGPARVYRGDHEGPFHPDEPDPNVAYGFHPKATGWLNHHPDKEGIAARFKDRLVKQGYDGIVYGNEFERADAGGKETSAIAFHPHQIEITQHHYGRSGQCLNPEECARQRRGESHPGQQALPGLEHTSARQDPFEHADGTRCPMCEREDTGRLRAPLPEAAWQRFHGLPPTDWPTARDLGRTSSWDDDGSSKFAHGPTLTSGDDDEGHSENMATRRTAALYNPFDDEHPHEWFHGSPHEFNEMHDPGETSMTAFEEGPERSHWNTLLGNHFSSDHDIAHEFSGGEHHPSDGYSDSEGPLNHVIHAKLHLKNPRVYKSEHDMDQEVHEHEYRAGNKISDFYDPGDRKMLQEDAENNPEAYHFHHEENSDNPYDRAQYGATGHPLATDWLNAHPKKSDIAARFKKRLIEQGHDGIVYGNEYEKSKHGQSAPSAVAFHPHQIEITQHHYGRSNRCATPEEAKRQPGNGQEMIPGTEHMQRTFAMLGVKADPFEHRLSAPLPGDAWRRWLEDFFRRNRRSSSPAESWQMGDDPAAPAEPADGTGDSSGMSSTAAWDDDDDDDEPSYHCPACGEGHEDEETRDQHMGAWTDWDKQYPHLNDTIHRGLMAHLPEHVADVVHDESRPMHERAGALAEHVRREGDLGMHWTDQLQGTDKFSGGEASHTRVPVIVHAHKPERHHIEEDPDTLNDHDVINYHDHDEYEVPMRLGAPVKVKGISWRKPGGHNTEWQHHDFKEPMGMTAMRKQAHDSGDGQRIFHCPFCGAGQVIARSDGTVECEFCHTAFTVQVQPQFSSFPQTDPVTGQPIMIPGMPGQIDAPGTLPGAPGGLPPGAEDDGSGNPFDDGSGAESGPPGADEGDDSGDDNKPDFLKGSSFRTAAGDMLTEEAYARHLALRFSADPEKMIETLRSSR